MTNPGHVDPGYKGPMRFTVINMGREPYVLRSGDAIVTLLLIKLARKAEAGWLTRRAGKPGGLPTQRDIERLSPDFANVEERATQLAREEIRHAEVQWKERQTKWIVYGSFISAVAVVFASIAGGAFVYLTGLKTLEQRVAIVEKDTQSTQSAAEIKQLKTDVESMKTSVTGLDLAIQHLTTVRGRK